MQAITKKSPITLFRQQFTFIIEKIQQKLDWKKIDQHESLTFLNKNYHQKPSDIAKILITIIAIVILFIEGLKIVTILMCYLLPIGVMILKMSQSVKSEREHIKQRKHKDKSQSQILSKQNIQKNESTLSIDSKVQSQKQLTEKSQHKKNQKEEPNIADLNKHFIFYFIFNLILELTEPIILLLIQTILDLFHLVLKSIVQLIQQGNFWSLLLIPFQFIGGFIAHLVTFSKISQYSIITLIVMRVVLSAFLLNMNKQKRKFCQKIFFKGRFLSLRLNQLNDDIKSKTQ